MRFTTEHQSFPHIVDIKFSILNRYAQLKLGSNSHLCYFLDKLEPLHKIHPNISLAHPPPCYCCVHRCQYPPINNPCLHTLPGDTINHSAPTCFNHLSDWLQVTWLPSDLLSPSLLKASNCVMRCLAIPSFTPALSLMCCCALCDRW